MGLEIAVVGAGLMGHGIAQAFATAGHSVRVTDSNQETLQAVQSLWMPKVLPPSSAR